MKAGPIAPSAHLSAAGLAAAFAGLWLGDKGEVHIAFTERARKRVRQLRKGPGRKLPGKRRKRLRAVRLDRSLLELRALQDRMNSDRRLDPVTIIVPGSGRDQPPRTIRPPYDLDIDATSRPTS